MLRVVSQDKEETKINLSAIIDPNAMNESIQARSARFFHLRQTGRDADNSHHRFEHRDLDTSGGKHHIILAIHTKRRPNERFSLIG
jgi:hypothetical protein